MPLYRLATLPLLCLSAALPAAAQSLPTLPPSSITVTVEGAVQAPGQYALPERARIGDAVIAAKPDTRAYVLGAALLRQEAKAEQLKLKAGLTYDLGELAKHKNADIAATANTLSGWLQAQPVTGRVLAQQLEPRLLKLRPELNPPAIAGDTVFFPARPEQVKVLGAVQHSCDLPQVPGQDAKTYLLACPVSTAADRDTVYVIQPDGVVQTLGIALWNRSSPQSLAPGAVLYVPLSDSQASSIDPEFNRQFAEFLATQLLPAPGASP